MNKLWFCGVVGVGMTVLVGCGAPLAPLPTVNNVEVERYLGKWYEIAKYPTVFQEGCIASTADYGLLDDGRISVLNTCREGDLDGPERSIEGSARIVDAETNAKLKVSFFLPIFEGDYWILELGDEEDYGYAVVGEPRRRSLWILSRSPQLDEAVLDGIRERLPELGYDPDGLEMSGQPEAAE